MAYKSNLSMLLCLLFVSIATAQRSSFANTRFDLSPDLPFEDTKPVAVAVAESKDDRPKQVLKQETPAFTQPLPPAPTTRPSLSSTPSFSTVPALAPLPSMPTFPPLAPLAPSSIPPFTLPSMPTLAPFSIASVTPPAPVVNMPPPPAQFIPAQGNRAIQLVPANQYRDKADLWFRDMFDAQHCVNNVEEVAEKFLQKFPRNLLKNKKELVLAELLSSRLKECARKQTDKEWSVIDQRIGTLSLPPSEVAECRTGLIQEEISCLNVQSYSCQFVQPAYKFRLVPTRIIVQEARLAEDGAEKCRKVAKLLRKQKQLPLL